ncbi:hypothetical protein ACTD5D_40910 [Nocardia takedensis]|uniref:hypothetical protein n=1 Tax=Nocardia takedensis TaxID=259390 RepID=UPI003F76AD48
MVRGRGIGDGRVLSCRVQLTWPGSNSAWWNPHLRGSGEQIAAAVEEMSTRVRLDPLAHTVLRADPHARVGYHLQLCAETILLTRHHPSLSLVEVPAYLRAHAADIRAHTPRPTREPPAG